MDDSWFGKMFNCPNCRGIIDVPSKHTHDAMGAVMVAQCEGRPRKKRAIYYALTAILLVLILIPFFWHGSFQADSDDHSQGATDYLQDRSSALTDRGEAPLAQGRASNAIYFYLQDIVRDYRDRFGDVPMRNYVTTVDEMLRENAEPDVVKIVDEVVMPRLAEMGLARDYDPNELRVHYRNSHEAPYPYLENLDPQTIDRLSMKAVDIAGVQFPVRSAQNEEKPVPEVASASTESATTQAPAPSEKQKPNIFNRVFRTKSGKEASEQTAPDPVEKLLASPELWPSEVTLARDTEFPAVLNGKVVGKVKVNAGATVGLTAVEADAVEVEFRGGKVKLPHKETNLSLIAAALDADPGESSESSSPSELEAAAGSQTGMAAPALASPVGTYQTTNADTTLRINPDGTAQYRSLVSVIHYKDAQHARKGLLAKDGARTTVSHGTWKTNDGKLTFEGASVVTPAVDGRQAKTNTAPLTVRFLREPNGDLVAPRGETSTRLIKQVPASGMNKTAFDASKPIKVGFNLAMTGGDASLDASSLKAAQLFFDEINDKGGLRVAGQPVKLEMIVRDNRSDGGQAAAVTRKLVSDDEVVAIVGPNSSFLAVPAAKVAENQKCILIAPWSTRQDTTHDPAASEPKEYVFRACFLNEHQIEALADFAFTDLKLRKAAILAPRGHQRSEDSQSWLFKKFFEKNGGEIVAFEFLDDNGDDSPAYSRIRSLKPEAIFSVDLSKDLLEKMKTWGIKAQLLGGDAWTRSQHLLSETSDQPIVGHYSTHFSADDTDSSASRFKSNYRKIYGEDPDEVAALTYDACLLLAEALKRANTLDRDKVRDELARLNNFRGVTGTFSYSDPPYDPNKSVFIVRVDKDSTRLVKEMRPKTRARTNPSRARTAEPRKSSGPPDTQKSDESSTPSVATTATVAEKARNDLRTQAPTATLIKAALSDFSYSGSSCSHAESQAMLRWIGASDYSKNDSSVTGKLPNAWDVTIWSDSYGKIGVYGVRYGQSRSSYAGNNSTYFEITRQ